jgi:hypothetical protein
MTWEDMIKLFPKNSFEIYQNKESELSVLPTYLMNLSHTFMIADDISAMSLDDNKDEIFYFDNKFVAIVNKFFQKLNIQNDKLATRRIQFHRSGYSFDSLCGHLKLVAKYLEIPFSFECYNGNASIPNPLICAFFLGKQKYYAIMAPMVDEDEKGNEIAVDDVNNYLIKAIKTSKGLKSY